MYNPIKDGIDATVQSVIYTEAKPPAHLSGLVHCFWELKTKKPLAKDFYYHALPDACVNILLNQVDPEIAGITALSTTFAVLNLGTSFHYTGIQFLPGVWQGDPTEIVGTYVGTAYQGNLPLVTTCRKLAGLDFLSEQIVLSDLVRQLIGEGIVVVNSLTEKIVSQIDSIHTVAQMALVAGLSPRQLQRTLKKITGFAPHDLLKVLRLQQAFRQGYLGSYTDQSHFIHAFRTHTGYTPAQYVRKFGV